ncbi:MAG: hypothetical protein JSV17_00355 [Candidatus Aminicenantes bacterium]|nr:MAG: hypothetical protein JSV17_00355 [Candidatus Aminicenantes bacterium]
MQNLSEKNPDMVRELRRKLVAWRKKVEAPLPSALNPGYDAAYDQMMRLNK